MIKFSIKFLAILFLIVLVGCAKRGTITGGLKDTLAPVLRYSFPKNGATNFSGNEVKLTFDEYVVLKDLNKQLIVSPPSESTPDIGPTNPTKTIIIKIKDTLKPNTTYSFNFGESIQDNNEANVLRQFKYIFSTGNAIDTLSVEGSIKDALEKTPDNFVSVMLYEVDEKFNDSVIYKQKPRYVTNTLDSTRNWKIDNIKAGKYLLVAVKDVSNNFKFNPKVDKIGFNKEIITIPTTEKFELKLFSETPSFKTIKAVQASGNRALVGFEGDYKNTKVVLKNGNNIIPTRVTKFAKKDSLQVWFAKQKTDSLQIEITNDKYNKKFTFKHKDQRKDTLSISVFPEGLIHFRENFEITTNTPIEKVDVSKIVILSKDSLVVKFDIENDYWNQKLVLKFKKEPSERYKIKLSPGAITDFFDNKNKNLAYKLDTKSITEYGNLDIRLENVKQYPVIVQLTTEKGDVLATETADKSPLVRFELILPNKFIVRVIYDTNKNGKWDAGNFLEKRQPEAVLYFLKTVDVRSNWDVDQPIDLSK